MGKWWHIECRAFRLHRSRPCRWLPLGRSEFRIGLGQWVLHLQAVKGKGICIVARVPRGHVGPPRPEHPQWRYPSMKKKMSRVAVAGGVRHLAAVETNTLSALMPLIEHCCLRTYDDGDPREPGWFTVKTVGSAWCVQVKDPDACVSFTATAETIDKALETAALLLACDEAPWEPDRYLAQQKATRSKK